ncbi:hypothetical protein PNOK_0130300 [Pyrrhoderma noxium]|uniref:Uncharacterized protein n=1 Tax=Pyrrhoderma noxium TaxID=2282107 RepID=A0A286UXP8_9AGAM|nr:hypothetical protein PNOK_0130300 [Pyrrhoderma noxium]
MVMDPQRLWNYLISFERWGYEFLDSDLCPCSFIRCFLFLFRRELGPFRRVTDFGMVARFNEHSYHYRLHGDYYSSRIKD